MGLAVAKSKYNLGEKVLVTVFGVQGEVRGWREVQRPDGTYYTIYKLNIPGHNGFETPEFEIEPISVPVAGWSASTIQPITAGGGSWTRMSGPVTVTLGRPKECECGKEKHGFASHSQWCPRA